MVLILTGPPAAGKSTIGSLIAAQPDRCAVVDVDIVRYIVRQPHIPPWQGNAGMVQLRLGARNGCMLARCFADEGYHVVIMDVLTDETALLYHAELIAVDHRIVLLLPELDNSLQRNQDRGQWLTDDEVRLLYSWQENLTIYDHRINNSQRPALEIAKELSSWF